MAISVCVVSRDLDWAESLEKACSESDYAGGFFHCPNATSAWQAYRNQFRAVLVLDLRSTGLIEDLELLFTWIQAGQIPPLLAIWQEGFPLRVLDSLDLLVSRSIRWTGEFLPIREWLDQLPSDGRTLLGGVTLPPQRSLTAESISLSTRTPSLFPVLDQIEQVGKHDVTLLIIGETGTGKTTLARLIHELSPRSKSRFMTTACGALPPDLIESELFGHVRGAFTSADRSKIGRFEAAEDGTLLLDEIDVLGGKEQAKLLRVIETGEFEPVGSAETRRSRARLIVASNVDLKKLTDENQFRSDLYYRLSVLEFFLPPLRERPLDLVRMSIDIIREISEEHRIGISWVHPGMIDVMREYAWPGNIRELKNQIRRAVLFSRQGTLSPETFSFQIPVNPVSKPPKPQRRSLTEQVAHSEKEILLEALKSHGFQRTATARSLGISRVGLYKKLRKYGLLETGPEE